MMIRQKTVVNRLLTLTLVVLLRMSLAAQEQTNQVPTCNNNPLAIFIITNLLAEPQPELSVPLTARTNVGPEGNYWRIQGPDLPLPFDPFVELPAYQIGTNQYLIDDRSVDYPTLNALLEAEAEADGWTNNPPATIPLMNTNGLWINVPTNSLDAPGYLSANLMNTLQGQSYDILTSASLPASWATELTVTGAVGNVTPVQLPLNGRTNLFLEARTSPDYSFYLLTQPLSQEVCNGDTVTFSVAAGGNSNLSFQWTLNGVAIPGATNSSCSLSGYLYPAEGYYACIISDGTNSLATAAGQLTTAWVSNDLGLMYLVGNRQDYTFKSGVTYYLGWPIQLYGNTTIEAGAVLKFDWRYNASLQIMGTLTCKGEPYYGAQLTSVDDDSVGEALLDPLSQVPFSAEDGPPQPYSTGVPYLDMTYATSNSISNLRFSYADWGVTTPVLSGTLDVWDCQFVQCNNGVVNLVAGTGAADNLHNVLFSQCAAAVAASTNAINIGAEQVTAQVSTFCLADSTPGTIALTNSIIWGNNLTASNLLTVSVVFNPDPTNFQPTGAGNYYLAPASPLHSAGTANISPRLQSELQAKTTYPPVVIAAFTTNSGAMTFSPQAPRYAGGATDLGWYYDALDYTVDDMTLNGGTLTVLPGTAIGYRLDTNAQGGGWNAIGFDVREDSSLISQGTPNHPNVFVDAQLVQEQFAWPIVAGIVPDFFPTYPNSQPPVLSFRFTKFRLNYIPCFGNGPAPAFHFWSGVDPSTLSEWSFDSAMYLTLQDCDLRGGQISLSQPDRWTYTQSSFWGTGAVGWTNNSFDNVAISLDPGYSGYTNVDLAFSACNNLFRGGQWLHLRPIPTSAGNWVFQDNLFDQVDLFQDSAVPTSFAHNGYWPLSTNSLQWDIWLCGGLWTCPTTPANSATLQPGGGTGYDVTLSGAPPYQAGPLGRFYLPASTALFGAGSRSAADAGLFHYTTRLDQLKEGEESSGHMGNIGVHYVATADAASFAPRDTDGDAIPDYVENWHGDGNYSLHTDTETDWQNPYTTAGIYDPTNSLYDYVDLSGSGLTGLAKKALGLNPLDPNSPLKLAQIITGDEPITSTFEVPVSYDAVTAAGFFHLNRDGFGATGEQLARASNGHCLLIFNQYFDPPGQHLLSANFRMGDQAADGPMLPFFSSNELQFEPAGAMFDDYGAYLDAKIFVDQADYVINLYDTSTTNETYILSITNTAYNGMIQEDWGVTNADGTPFTRTSVRAEFALASTAGKKPSKPLQRATGSLSEWGLNFNVAYMYTPTNGGLSSAFAKGGDVWNGVQGVVDYLIAPRYGWDHYNSDFNRYLPDARGEYPGYLTSRAMVTNNLCPTLAGAKQFYCYAHGSSNWIGNWAGDTYITAGEIGGLLQNSRSNNVLIANNPYRSAFLDGCSTASTLDWQTAFGIAEKSEVTRNKTGPQAYVGWAKDSTGWMNGSSGTSDDLMLAKAYTKTLQFFYADWMTKVPLAECIDHASLSLNDTVPFPVPQNKITRIHMSDGTTYENRNVDTSRIYIVGHPGLTVDGFDRTTDTRTDYKRQ